MTDQIAYIDQQPYAIKEDESILNFVRRHLGKQSIPTLCNVPNVSPVGACRLCTVEVKAAGQKAYKVVGSCHTPVAEAMMINTNSSIIKRLRKNILELVLTDHPLECLTCDANNNCELQEVAANVGITNVRYPEGQNHLKQEKDVSHPYMLSDLSKCINCHLCIDVCDQVQGEFVLSMYSRGFDSRVIKGADVSFANSNCVSCGACSQACPTAAISDINKPLQRSANRKVQTICTYCGVGCQLEVDVNNNDEILGISSPYESEVNQGHTCLKGRYAFQFYKHPDRLKKPLIKHGGKFKEVSWQEALDFIANRLTEIKEKDGPDAIGGISSSRCTNEENYLMQKFMRAVIGTNNIDGCARLCHAPTAVGMQRTFGTGAATNSIKDLALTNCILVIGANPTTAHPVTGAKIKQQAIKGKTLIVVDPRETELARYADYHLQLRPGTNVALLNMMIYFIIKEQLIDKNFVKNRCEGYEDFVKQQLEIDISSMEKITGVDQYLVKEAARAYATAANAMSFHGLGVTEHTQGTFAVMLIADLAMITGNIGRKGTGVNPLRGQNNVQGAADMGVQPNQGAGYLDVTDAKVAEHYQHHFGVSVPRHVGLTIPEMLTAAADKQLKALWIMGEHVLQTEPNTSKVIRALENLDLLIVQEIFMTETAQMANVVLPAASFLEKNGTFTNGERRVQRVNQVIAPIGDAKPDGQIIVEIMQKMGYPQPKYHPATMIEEISRVVPFFEGIKWNELGKQGKQWPVDLNGKSTEILHRDTFKRGKGKLIFNDFKESEEIVNYKEDYPFILTTNRELEHYNCSTMTGRTDDMKLMDEDVLLINPQDAKRKNIKDHEKVYLKSARGEILIRVEFSSAVKPGILSTTFHFPEISVNKLTSDTCDTEAICPEYKVIAVEIKKL